MYDADLEARLWEARPFLYLVEFEKKIFENKDKQSLHVQKKVFVPTNSVDRIVEHKLRALQYNHDFT